MALRSKRSKESNNFVSALLPKNCNFENNRSELLSKKRIRVLFCDRKYRNKTVALRARPVEARKKIFWWRATLASCFFQGESRMERKRKVEITELAVASEIVRVARNGTDQNDVPAAVELWAFTARINQTYSGY